MGREHVARERQFPDPSANLREAARLERLENLEAACRTKTDAARKWPKGRKGCAQTWRLGELNGPVQLPRKGAVLSFVSFLYMYDSKGAARFFPLI